MPRTLRTVSWVVALLAVLATGAGYLYRWYQAQQADAWALELDGRPAPSFTLTSHLGQPVRLDELTGRITVVTFAHTSCPDVCPLTLQSIAAAHRECHRTCANTCNSWPSRSTPSMTRWNASRSTSRPTTWSDFSS